MTSVCISCGFTSDEQDAKFCPNCGGTLEIMAAPQVAPASVALPGCPSCGSRANAAGARFCQQCGANLSGAPAPAATPAVQVIPIGVPAAAAPASGNKVMGGKIKMMPIARMLSEGQDQSGLIELHTDGILFFGKGMNVLASLHVSEIARANPGAKSNLLDVQMKDGRMITFKFMSARDWAGLINQNLR